MVCFYEKLDRFFYAFYFHLFFVIFLTCSLLSFNVKAITFACKGFFFFFFFFFLMEICNIDMFCNVIMVSLLLCSCLCTR